MNAERIDELKKFCSSQGLELQNLFLLDKALTHTSFAYEMDLPYKDNNERLEFLGDSVLQICVSEALFNSEPALKEGPMSKMRAIVVCEQSLAAVARKISLGRYLKLGKGEDHIGGRDGEANLANALEAVIGAVYLDKGLKKAQSFVLKILGSTIEEAKQGKIFFDYKSKLIELIQDSKKEHKIQFQLVDSTGPVHNPTFIMALLMDGTELTRSSARSKKKAEQMASRILLRNLAEFNSPEEFIEKLQKNASLDDIRTQESSKAVMILAEDLKDLSLRYKNLGMTDGTSSNLNSKKGD